jgi:transcriptional regulator with XRE-family HTH domain
MSGDQPPNDLGKPVNFGEAVGQNVQRIRAELGMSQSVLARMLTTNGDRWTKGNVAALERGTRKQVTDAELAQLANALNVRVSELYRGDGYLLVGENGVIERSAWRAALDGVEPPAVAVTGADAVAAPLAVITRDFLAFEVADKLGVSITQVSRAAKKLYRRSVTAEQAARVGPVDDPTSQSTAVRRGNVTRQLVAEIRNKIEGDGS